jgi:hypothetical protein
MSELVRPNQKLGDDQDPETDDDESDEAIDRIPDG